jgi:arylsulfatase A-like enzyme
MKRFNSIATVLLGALLSLITTCGYAEEGKSDQPKLNVLFIAIDDLRPELGCYGFSQIKSPNIDALAKQGLQFNRAYCQFALCNPSRSSLLTGERPETIRIYNLATFVRTHAPDVVTLPQLFKNNGYEARSVGKIFHVTNGNHEDDVSWSTHAWQTPRDDHPRAKEKKAAQKPAGAVSEDFEPDANGVVRAKELKAASGERTKSGKRSVSAEPFEPRADMLPYESPDVADNKLLDGQIADKAVSVMEEIKNKPFFLAVGFHKPHMPWIAPKKYWDMYSDADIHLAEYQKLPAGAPAFASNEAGEFRSYKGVPKEGPIPDEIQRAGIHSYFACISYTDAQIGKVVAQLDRLGLRKNTVIILWGDHGYQLGEHGTWNKRTNWEVAARVPLMISVPGQKRVGEKTDALVELVDMYPTLAELCGLKPPATIEGRSFEPLVENPKAKWKEAAFTTYHKPLPEMGTGFGRAMRTDRYRFVEWSGPKSEKRVYELYDEQNDPLEKVNIADQPENAELVAKLSRQLHAAGK